MSRKSTKTSKPKTSKLAKNVAALRAGVHTDDPRVFGYNEAGTPDFLRGFFCQKTHTYVSHFTCAVGGCAKSGGKGCPIMCSDEARKSVFFYHVTKGKLPIPSHLKLFYDITKDKAGDYEITFTKLADSGVRKPRIKRVKKAKPMVKPSSKSNNKKKAVPKAEKKPKTKTKKVKAVKTATTKPKVKTSKALPRAAKKASPRRK